MNHLRQHIRTYSLCVLALLFLTTPLITSAEDASASASFAQEIVYNLLVMVTGTFLRIGGIVFDYGINTFVVGFGDLYANSGVGFAVDNAWVTIRDFVNLFFIFGLVYIGIKLILDANDSNTRRWLVNLVIAALLINFSLFITKFLVDFSNQLSYEIAQGAGWYNDIKGNPQDEINMSERILLYMGITEIFNLSGPELPNASWGYIFGTAIFFTITAFILAAGGFLLIIRFAMLNLFLVMSPLMFLSWVLPPLQDTMDRYWKGFLGRAFFAPVYFMFMYFSLEILKGFQTYIKGGLGNSGSNWAGTLAGENGKQVLASTQSTIPFFFLICIFMIASLVIASKMGADFGSKAVGLGKSLSNKAGNYAKRGAGGVAFGSTARLGQATVGLGANKLASNRRFQNLASKNKVARAALRGTRGIADSSFDARRIGGLGKELGIGEGIKGGYDTSIKNKKKRDEEFYKSLDDADMKDPKNKLKASELTEEKKSESEAILESNTKETADLTSEIDTLGTEIESLTKALEEQVKGGTITSAERYTAERNIVQLQKRRDGVTKVRDEKISQEILFDKINQAGLDASLATDPKVKAQLREQRQILDAQLSERVATGQKMITDASALFDTNEDGSLVFNQNRANTQSQNAVKYENKITYLNAKKKTFSSENGRFKFNPAEEESYNNLVKKFGADAGEIAKKSKEEKENKKLAQQIAAVSKAAEKDGDKKEEKKDGDSE